MKQVIIGTAGHVDHGKTSLIHALTGIDTDRLAEEKRRGLTIDLGFAHLRLGGVCAGVVDVPGHERFLGNMLAGAGQIDLALMVVAADEGVMPQTLEHLEALSLLGVGRGVIALTKADLVAQSDLELACSEVRERFAGSFLRNAPLMAVSVKTGAGLDALCAALEAQALAVPPRDENGSFRLHVDRVFTLKGFGVVAAGVVAQGSIGAEDMVSIVPRGTSARVRGIQVYGEQRQRAVAGQRAALNLARIGREEISRGDVLTGSPQPPCTSLDVALRALASSGEITNQQRTHLFLGTSSVLCRIALLGRDRLAAGESGYAQLRLESPVAACAGERFVLRFYSPLATIGGGVVLALNSPRYRRSDARALEMLRIAAEGTPREQVLSALGGAEMPVAQARELLWRLASEQFDKALVELTQDHSLMLLGDFAISGETFRSVQARTKRAILDGQGAGALPKRMPQAQWKREVLSRAQLLAADAILEALGLSGEIAVNGGVLALADATVTLPPKDQALAEELLRFFEDRGFVPSPLQEPERGASKDAQRMARQLCAQNLLVRIPPECYLAKAHYDEALRRLKQHFAACPAITLAQYRDLLGISRKPAQMILEHFDDAKITRKIGDERVLRGNVSVTG